MSICTINTVAAHRMGILIGYLDGQTFSRDLTITIIHRHRTIFDLSSVGLD